MKCLMTLGHKFDKECPEHTNSCYLQDILAAATYLLQKWFFAESCKHEGRSTNIEQHSLKKQGTK